MISTCKDCGVRYPIEYQSNCPHCELVSQRSPGVPKHTHIFVDSAEKCELCDITQTDLRKLVEIFNAHTKL